MLPNNVSSAQDGMGVVLEQIVQEVFSTMLDLDVSTTLTDSPLHPNRLTGTVYLEGETWNGAVSIECEREMACRLSGRLLASPPPPAVNDEVVDALGELANMIGGNLKPIIAPDSRISMPSVIDGSSYELRVCGSASRDRLIFRSEDGPFWVSLLTKDLPSPNDLD